MDVLTAATLAISIASGDVIEPDDFAERAVLNNVSPLVTLSTALSDNTPTFDVTANEDPFGFAPSGVKVFGHANVPFFNNERRLRMDFTTPADSVSLMFAGSLTEHVGRLEIYDVHGDLIDAVEVGPVDGLNVDRLDLSTATPEISYAVAYATGTGDFGRLDALEFTVPAPAALAALSLLAFARGLRRR